MKRSLESTVLLEYISISVMRSETFKMWGVLNSISKNKYLDLLLYIHFVKRICLWNYELFIKIVNIFFINF